MSDIVIIPSYYDAYPCVSIECFRSGILPIVSTNCGSASDLKDINSLLVITDTLDIDEWASKIIEISQLTDADYMSIVTQRDFVNDNFRKQMKIKLLF